MNSLSRCQPRLGTYVEIELRGQCSDQHLLSTSNAMFAEVERIESLMSFHNADSELSQLNRTAHHKPCPVSPDMVYVLQQAQWLSKLSGGLYDITVAPQLIDQGLLPAQPQRVSKTANWRDIILCGDAISFRQPLLIDLGGIAKGYAVDCAMALLDSDMEATISAGGDLRMSHWKNRQVAIRQPDGKGSSHTPQPVVTTMLAPAMATSASYFLDSDNQQAMINPLNRQPFRNDHSISVFANNCIMADALTKWVCLSRHPEPLLKTLAAKALIIDSLGCKKAL